MPMWTLLKSELQSASQAPSSCNPFGYVKDGPGCEMYVTTSFLYNNRVNRLQMFKRNLKRRKGENIATCF